MKDRPFSDKILSASADPQAWAEIDPGIPPTPDLPLPNLPKRINVDPEAVERGLVRLVLTLVELIRDLLERQAVRRVETGRLTDAEIERLGQALLKLDEQMQMLKTAFGLTDADLRLDLGPVHALHDPQPPG